MDGGAKQIEMYFRQGMRLHGGGRLAEAEHIYRQILSIAPGHGDAADGLGVLALQAGQPHVAVEYLDQAIASKPSTALYHVHRANALLVLRRHDEAIAACRTALRYKRSSADAFQVLGHALSDSGHAEEALSAYRDALRLRPALPDIHNNLGVALRNLGRLEEAESRLREANRRTPEDSGVLVNLSSVLKELGKVREAETRLREALRLSPSDPVLHYNLGLLLLLTGQFVEGWAGFEYRFASGAVPERGFTQPQWLGEPLEGRTLLIHSEQGLGDTIQFCRFAPQVAGQVVLEVPRRLVRLLSGLRNVPELVAAGDPLPPFELICPLMSLPGRLRIPIEAIGHTVPYLVAEPALVARWHSRLGDHGFKVGIAWQGNPERYEDHGRSVHLTRFKPLTGIPGIRLISLQCNSGTEQLGEELPKVESYHGDLDTGPDAFVDTAAVISNLDLVISTDTSIAHLAGALGCPVWTPLRKVPDWRWTLDAPNTPWYPTMQLFRQGRRNEWEPVFLEIAQQLATASGKHHA
jgi:tetratricopeptide (TPR) repeat protein